MDNRIEHHITIKAGLDRVWELVTRPGWWVPSVEDGAIDATIDRTPGHQTIRENEQYGRFPVEVVAIDPPTYAAFRWASQFPGEELTPGHTTLVEFRVAQATDAVTVTVDESGFAELDASEDIRRAGFEDNSAGWPIELDVLRSRAEGPPAD